MYTTDAMCIVASCSRTSLNAIQSAKAIQRCHTYVYIADSSRSMPGQSVMIIFDHFQKNEIWPSPFQRLRGIRPPQSVNQVFSIVTALHLYHTMLQYVGHGTTRLAADDKRVLVHQAMLLVDALAECGETDLSKLRQAAKESVLAQSEVSDYPDTVFNALADKIGGGGMALVDLSSESHCYLCLSHVPANPQTDARKRSRKQKSWHRLQVIMDGVMVTKKVCDRCRNNIKQSCVDVSMFGSMTCHVVDCVRCIFTETLICTFKGCNKVIMQVQYGSSITHASL